jgi:peptidoglycan/LPS O-acetylase OafA/YrhL
MPNKSISLQHLKYRPDIDGLRAIAVLAVVAFHAFPDLMTGGFIGVDIFFVISGFLITTIIYHDLDNGTFKFSLFYSRRIKRIFPALILVLIFCYAIGWFVLLSDEFKQLGKHIAAGAGFIANLVLWNEAGYFDNAADTKPLLHLWSLGIEEQFYIAWPLVIWFSYKHKFNLIVITIVICTISFLWNIAWIQREAVTTFFFPQTRFWELLVGAALAWCSNYGGEIKGRVTSLKLIHSIIGVKKRHWSDVLSIAGLLLLFYGFLVINKNVPFPGIWALVPTIGATLIIAAGSSALVNQKFLANKVLVSIGLISFPLYLWHWPLLTFFRIIESKEPHVTIRIMLVCVSFFLAWFTYRFIETPFRVVNSRNQIKVGFLIVSMFIVGYLGFNAYERSGLPFRIKDREAFEAYFENSPPNFKFFY